MMEDLGFEMPPVAEFEVSEDESESPYSSPEDGVY
jgi:hypothetical protein